MHNSSQRINIFALTTNVTVDAWLKPEMTLQTKNIYSNIQCYCYMIMTTIRSGTKGVVNFLNLNRG